MDGNGVVHMFCGESLDVVTTYVATSRSFLKNSWDNQMFIELAIDRGNGKKHANIPARGVSVGITFVISTCFQHLQERFNMRSKNKKYMLPSLLVKRYRVRTHSLGSRSPSPRTRTQVTLQG